MAKKTCFVVMGFGEKPDFATGRTLDLDKSYRVIIKRAVEDAGLECIRADDVVHAGIIDKPMYELLLNADVVVADLSTSNLNAIYELGVRHALRPHTTIILAESEFKFPFDLAHVVIRKYQHLGKGIDAEVAEQLRSELRKAIEVLVEKPQVDSPVYTFLSHLTAWSPSAPPAPPAPAPAAAPRPTTPADERASTLLEMFREARAQEDWLLGGEMLRRLLERNPSDSYLNQQLALATYKCKQPDVQTSLARAKAILQALDPQHTTDAETLGLWGAVHKRLWEATGDRQALDEAIWALEKGFYVKGDHYNGINLAYLFNLRATVASTARDAIADATIAERIRLRVMAICEKQRAAPITDDRGKIDREQMFWVNASLVEALVGTGQTDRAIALQQEIAATAPESWMPKTLQEQLDKLTVALAAVPPAARQVE